MSASKAKRLLTKAAKEEARLKRHLLVAAALREVLQEPVVVVGGTAEEFWTSDSYHQTDLDICTSLGPPNQEKLRQLGFRKEGRHWVRDDIDVAVEFPEAFIDGDDDRTLMEEVEDGYARIIGVDDLYFDRLRQATVSEGAQDVHFHSALAVVAARYAYIDWGYVERRIEREIEIAPKAGQSMSRIDKDIRRRVRRAL